MSARRTTTLLAAALCVVAAACASRGAPVVPVSQAHIADVHQRKCGACHRIVEPSTRSRDAIDSALARHQKRLHLSRDEWQALADYLAPPGGSSQAKSAER